MVWLAAGLLALAQATTPPPPPVVPVALSAAWTSVPLPDEPLDIIARQGVLWVVGANEMIADSTDDGQTWTLRHQRKHGALLFAIHFLTARHLVAYGSDQLWLESRDGGQTWRRHGYRPLAAIEEVAMFRGHRGFLIASDAFGATTDGNVWKLRNLAHGHRAGFSQLVALDPLHAAILAYLNDPDEGIISTADGGRHWQVTPLQGRWIWNSLRVERGGYTLYGGRRHSPSMAHSTDGLHWMLGPPPPAVYSQCTHQGCLLAGGGWVDLRAATPTFSAVPPDPGEPLTLHWASAGSTFCRIAKTLRCRRGRQPLQLRTAPRKSAPALALRPPRPTCASCPIPFYPEAARAMHLTGTVILNGWISRQGRLRQTVVAAAPALVLANAAYATVREWRFHVSPRSPQPRDQRQAEVEILFDLRGAQAFY